jgi:hypothetical protein
MAGLSVEEAAGRCGSRWVAALSLLLVVGLWLVWVSVAGAGGWVQVSCAQSNGAPAPVEGWLSSSNGAGSGSGAGDTCEQRGGALTAFDGANVPQAAYSGPLWTYSAPGGSTIAGGSLSVSLRTPHGQAYVATPQNVFTSSADVLVNCQYNEPCGSDGTYTGMVPIVHIGGTQLFMAALCVAPGFGETTCPAHSGEANAEIHLYAADVELQNGSTPTATGFAGSLLASAASGIANLTFGAQDPEGPGVYRVVVDVDGTAVYQGTPDANGGRCSSVGVDPSGVSEFLYAQPCKRNVAVDVPVDTTKFPNGQHQLKVTVQDAAGNSAVVYDGTISIANPGAPTGTAIGPGSPAAVRGPANGTNASDQAKLTVRWASTTKALRTSRYGQADRVTGRLTTSTGQPISGAVLDVRETPAVQGAKTVPLARISTGPTGTWSLTLPKGISSSALRFAYRSHVEDTVPVATAALTLRVHAGIALKIAPRISSVGRSIVFSGTLHGTPIPPGGKQLVLEASSGGEWIEFRTITTDAHGRYRARYRFKLPGPVRYRFRVLSRGEADFPFLGGTSNVVAVHER